MLNAECQSYKQFISLRSLMITASNYRKISENFLSFYFNPWNIILSLLDQMKVITTSANLFDKQTDQY